MNDRIRTFQLYFDVMDEDLYKDHPKPRFFVYLGIESPLTPDKRKPHCSYTNVTPLEYHPAITEVQIDSLIKNLRDIKTELREKFRKYDK